MSLSILQGLYNSQPTTSRTILSLILQQEDIPCDDPLTSSSMSSSCVCPLDVFLTALDLYRSMFDTVNAMQKATIQKYYFAWPLGMSMYKNRYLALADLDAKCTFFMDTYSDDYPIVHTYTHKSTGWVCINSTGRMVSSTRHRREIHVSQIVSDDPWHVAPRRDVAFDSDTAGIVFLEDEINVAVCVENENTVHIVNTDTGADTRVITSSLLRGPCGICRHPTRKDLVIVSNFGGDSCAVVSVVTGVTVQAIEICGAVGGGPNGITMLNDQEFALCLMLDNHVRIFSGWNTIDINENAMEVTVTKPVEVRHLSMSCVRILCHGSRLYVSDTDTKSITVLQ